MNFLLSVACGVATYQVLFKILGLDDAASEAVGWAIGLGFIVFSDTIIAYFAQKGQSNKMKLRIKELELQVQVLEKSQALEKRNQDKMSFFKKEL